MLLGSHMPYLLFMSRDQTSAIALVCLDTVIFAKV